MKLLLTSAEWSCFFLKWFTFFQLWFTFRWTITWLLGMALFQILQSFILWNKNVDEESGLKAWYFYIVMSFNIFLSLRRVSYKTINLPLNERCSKRMDKFKNFQKQFLKLTRSFFIMEVFLWHYPFYSQR